MAGAVSVCSPQSTTSTKLKPIKELLESAEFTSIPSSYTLSASAPDHVDPAPDDPIPVIDLSLLTSGTPDQRSKLVRDLGKACEEWGFFIVVNHGVPEGLLEGLVDKCVEFFGLSLDEKQEYESSYFLDPIQFGTSYNVKKEEVHYWRDYLRIIVHPKFHSPQNPPSLSEAISQFSQQVRRILLALLGGISLSLGLEESCIEKSMNLDSGLQVFVANYYPPCPQPKLALGLPSHSDHGLLTILASNQVGGLQVLRHGRWIQVDTLPNSLVVNTGDQLEVLSNGKYKSILHQAVVNSNAMRLSALIANGPALDTVVRPAEELADPPRYEPMKYKDYLEMLRTEKLNGKWGLDKLKI